MRRTAAGAAALTTWYLVGLLVTLQSQALPRMNTTIAREHVGEVAMVCGHVIGYGCSVEDGTTLTLATDNERRRFRFLIPHKDREKFGRNPEDFYLQRLVCTTGRIEARESLHQIVMSDPGRVSVLPDLPGLPPFAPDIHRPCQADVALPRALREVKPQYTRRAMSDRVQGTVLTQAVVKEDGTVGDVRVVRGLHRELDAEATKAVRQWRFAPGTFQGQPVPIVVTVELTFTLRD